MTRGAGARTLLSMRLDPELDQDLSTNAALVAPPPGAPARPRKSSSWTSWISAHLADYLDEIGRQPPPPCSLWACRSVFAEPPLPLPADPPR